MNLMYSCSRLALPAWIARIALHSLLDKQDVAGERIDEALHLPRLALVQHDTSDFDPILPALLVRLDVLKSVFNRIQLSRQS